LLCTARLHKGDTPNASMSMGMQEYCLNLLTARSTRWSLPARTLCLPSGPLSLHSMVTVNIAWDRELCAFILVAPTAPVGKHRTVRK